jgi:hypothetical protein
MMNSERAFVTFRIAGDNLEPKQVTELLGDPTLSYAKGETYTRKGRTYVGRTGVWFISTDGVVKSNKLQDHVQFLFQLLRNPMALKMLPYLIKQKSLHAVMTLFWSGPPGAPPPHERDIDALLRLVHYIPFKIETDFADDMETSEGPPPNTVYLG